MILFKGEEVTFAELARRYKLSDTTLHRRYDLGLRDETLVKAIRLKKVIYKGHLATLIKVSTLTGICLGTLKHRYARGLRGAKLVSLTNGNKNKIRNATKLTPKKALDIYRLAHSGQICQDTLAKRYKVHPSTISDIKRGKRWGSVTQS